jgi:hypothetical protein
LTQYILRAKYNNLSVQNIGIDGWRFDDTLSTGWLPRGEGVAQALIPISNITITTTAAIIACVAATATTGGCVASTNKAYAQENCDD